MMKSACSPLIGQKSDYRPLIGQKSACRPLIGPSLCCRWQLAPGPTPKSWMTWSSQTSTHTWSPGYSQLTDIHSPLKFSFFQRWVGVRRGLRPDRGQGGARADVWQGGHERHVQPGHAGEDGASGYVVSVILFLDRLCFITEIPRCKYRCYVCTKMIGDLYINDFVLCLYLIILLLNTEGRVITAMGNKFHPECFVCTYCRGPFRDRLIKQE